MMRLNFNLEQNKNNEILTDFKHLLSLQVKKVNTLRTIASSEKPVKSQKNKPRLKKIKIYWFL